MTGQPFRLTPGRLAGVGVLILLAVFRLWMTDAQEFLARIKPHDDSLFLSLAANLGEGRWLGDFNNRTLIKGPGYPLFITAMHRLGVPLLLAQQILYVLACGLAMLAVRRWCRSSLTLGLGFALLLFNPASFHDPVVVSAFRESFYLSLALAMTACLVGIALGDGRLSGRNLAWSLLLGVVTAWLWITREESIWVIPGFIFVALLFLPPWPWLRRSRFGSRLALVLVPAAMVAGTVATVSHLNQRHYQVPYLVDIKSPEFVSALGGLMNIRQAEFARTQVVGPVALGQALQVSPALAELTQGFVTNRYPSSFFLWTLRSAARQAGYYQDAADGRPSLDLYRRIGEEIAAACAAEKLDCLDRPPTLRPPWLPQHWQFLGESLQEIATQAIGFNQFKVYSAVYPSGAPDDYLAFAAEITGENPARRTRRAQNSLPPEFIASRDQREYLMKRFVNVYQYLVPLLCVVAFIVLGRRMVHMLSARVFDRSALLALLPLGYVLTLIMMLTYVLVTIWPVDRPLHTVYPLVLFFIVLALCTRPGCQLSRDS